MTVMDLRQIVKGTSKTREADKGVLLYRSFVVA
jgi:hypothetical protein